MQKLSAELKQDLLGMYALDAVAELTAIGIEITHCGCCGHVHFEKKDEVLDSECYTDCIFYEGEEPSDSNPH